MGRGEGDMGCCQSTLVGSITLQSFLEECDTGDVILFNNPNAITCVTKCFTRSKWDHVGMVLKYTEKASDVILVESAGGGVFLCYAQQRLMEIMGGNSPTVSPAIIGYRKLMCGAGPMNEARKKRIHEEAQKQVDKPYEECFGEILKAVLGQDGFLAPNKIAEALGFEWAGKGEDIDSLFCSELVAHLLKKEGILPEGRDSNTYLPKDFSHASNARLDICHPFEFKIERQVTLSPSGSADVGKNTRGKGQGTDPIMCGGKQVTLGSLISSKDGVEARKKNLAAFEGRMTSRLNPNDNIKWH